MFEHIFASLSAYDPVIIYTLILFIPFVENLFPPSPSDVMVVLAGSLITKGTINFFAALMLSAAGCEIGFMLLYYIGLQTDRKLIHAGKLKFISQESVLEAGRWFTKYGYALILFNRFLSGVRAVISFFAGVSELKMKRTLILSSIGSLVWNAILLGLGVLFGYNLSAIDHFLSTYTLAISILTLLVAAFFGIRYFIKKKG